MTGRYFYFTTGELLTGSVHIMKYRQGGKPLPVTSRKGNDIRMCNCNFCRCGLLNLFCSACNDCGCRRNGCGCRQNDCCNHNCGFSRNNCGCERDWDAYYAAQYGLNRTNNGCCHSCNRCNRCCD